jgi:PTH1 family peptidyl-tRNA hydrolase
VGLGNPGPQYADTRHNVGFRVVDEVARRLGLLFRPAQQFTPPPGTTTASAKGFSFALARARSERGDAAAVVPDAPHPEPLEAWLLVRPETFMNRSGEPLEKLVACLGLDPGSMLVTYDDLDLPLGSLRIRPHGGHGGHNGMRSLLDRLGTDRFPRLRLGIGRRSTDAARHVLSEFTPDEQVEVEISIREAADAALDWLVSGDVEQCMTRFHSRWSQGS